MTVAGSVTTLAKHGGPLRFYRGFVPYWFQMAPWAMIMFLSLEQYKRLARMYLMTASNGSGPDGRQPVARGRGPATNRSLPPHPQHQPSPKGL